MDLGENMLEISIESEMKKSYLDYAMSVIIGRALPDVRDGLKPVHRRVLFTMHEQKNDYNKPYKKSARVVGDVMGKYHPHGDAAIYDTMVRMAQDFSLRYPLVDGQGNFGSIDGDPPAAMRYTEVRMQKMAHAILEDLDKETVDFIPNYDETIQEPTVLPTRIPNLLVNGSAGIAVGMATNIPPHNLGEITDALCALIENPKLTPEEMLQYVPGPDFPTGGIIYGRAGIHSAYSTGRGIIKIRARIMVEKDNRTGKETLVVTELPYQVNKARVIEKIAQLMKDKVIEGLAFVRDESDRDGMRIAMGLKKDEMASIIINKLYKHTQLENSFGIILLSIVNNKPELLNLKETLQYFIAHRKVVVIRRTKYELAKAEARAHILEGYKIAIDNLDEVVKLIRASSTPLEAREGLMARFDLTQIQAQAILDMRLQKLTGLEIEKVEEEYRELIKAIARYKEILASDQLVLEIVRDELLEVRAEYADERRTEIVDDEGEITIEDMIVEEDMVVTISHRGYIKRNPLTLYHSQRRGGKGKIGMGTGEEDFVSRLFVASTHNTLLFFTNLGRVYWRKVYEIPQAGRAAKGKFISNLLNLAPDEQLTTVLDVKEFEPGYNIIMATKDGIIKKTDLLAYSNPRSNGIIALSLGEGDQLIAARISDGTQNVFLGSAFGKSIRFHESDVRAMGRVSRGVKGMTLAAGDHLVGMEVLTHGKTLFSCTENGFGKRTSLDEYPLQKRGGKGVITIRTHERNGHVVSILVVSNDDDLMLMTNAGKIIRMPMADISVISRNTMGVRLMGMEPGERLIGAQRLAEKDEEK
ncbi:DNA gyrase subunit A [Desulfatibacillum alkenivorans DSM 16219]|jgi:DNA gyrase subunit A|uniref:DNA gyrase subunit A n=1 Tax=Desulfatibacillum alkenivorans DSM 16219 TaxID=1121393 RepID=A0A1M6TSM4_9BACT|nr:DNA gyrase subunit A [Desulfatibacillum alkenivorans]SHK60002.1 DNA gyrase subunit A [Desulfatibacillum alkenivorans DSM 16219]